MMNAVFREILYFISFLLLAILCLPLFFVFLQLVESQKSFSELLVVPNFLIGTGVILFNIYFVRLTILLIKPSNP